MIGKQDARRCIPLGAFASLFTADRSAWGLSQGQMKNDARPELQDLKYSFVWVIGFDRPVGSTLSLSEER
jgi:hypothetical protein